MESPQLLRDLPTDLDTNDSFGAAVVGYCLARRWAADPSHLELLLQYLVTTHGIGQFNVLLTRVRARIDPNPNPYQSSWLLTVHPFFDRADLRTHVQSLVEQTARPVLRVLGTPGSGRTYSRRFLEHLEEQLQGDTHVLSAELSPETGPSYSVKDLIAVLAAQLGLTEEPPARSGSSYGKSVCMWFLARLVARPGKWIIILDGFGQEGLNQDVRQLIEALAASIPLIRFRTRIRLVLVDYPQPLPQLTPAEIMDDLLQPSGSLTWNDLVPCIQEWDARNKAAGKPGVAQTDIPSLAQGMLARAPADGKARLMDLNQQLQSLLKL